MTRSYVKCLLNAPRVAVAEEDGVLEMNLFKGIEANPKTLI